MKRIIYDRLRDQRVLIQDDSIEIRSRYNGYRAVIYKSLYIPPNKERARVLKWTA